MIFRLETDLQTPKQQNDRILYFTRKKQKVIDRLPDKLYIYLQYVKTKKRPLRLVNPKTFCEKLQWLKINGNLESYSKFVDKFDSREYVSAAIGDEYLIPLLGRWTQFKEIQFEKLPDRFVLKATHGCEYNYICTDKASLDMEKLEKQISGWLAEDYYKIDREAQYKNCRPSIICEQYLEDEFGELRDYKILCFNGKPRIIEVHTARFSQHTGDYFDTTWKRLDWKIGYKKFPGSIQKPDNLAGMLDAAEKLAKGFHFVRVDLYSVRQKIYFGELTFTPGNGLTYFGEADKILGRMLDLSAYKVPAARLPANSRYGARMA